MFKFLHAAVFEAHQMLRFYDSCAGWWLELGGWKTCSFRGLVCGFQVSDRCGEDLNLFAGSLITESQNSAGLFFCLRSPVRSAAIEAATSSSGAYDAPQQRYCAGSGLGGAGGSWLWEFMQDPD